MKVDDVPIAEPCSADWGAMRGNASRRHCTQCDRHVHNLSAMSEGAARRLLQRAPGVCVRYTCRTDGTVVHREPRLGARLLPRFAALAGAFLAAAPAHAGPALAIDDTRSDPPSAVQVVLDRISAYFVPAEPIPEVEEPPHLTVQGGLPVPPPPPPPILMGKPALPRPIPEVPKGP